MNEGKETSPSNAAKPERKEEQRSFYQNLLEAEQQPATGAAAAAVTATDSEDVIPEGVPVPRSRRHGRRSDRRRATSDSFSVSNASSRTHNTNDSFNAFNTSISMDMVQMKQPTSLNSNESIESISNGAASRSSSERRRLQGSTMSDSVNTFNTSISTMEMFQAKPVALDNDDSADSVASWYQEALDQGLTESELKTFLMSGPVNNSASTANTGLSEDEVLEQYRMMALHEARQRVKENLGYDPSEVEQPKPEPIDTTPKFDIPLPKISMPQLQPNPDLLGPTEPTGPFPFLQYTRPKCRQQPELQRGVPLNGQLEEQEISVQCLGCQSSLAVNQEATLVQCPSCATVSPASSTRH